MDQDVLYRVSPDPTEEHRGAEEEAETSSLHIWNPAESSTHQPCCNSHSKIITFNDFASISEIKLRSKLCVCARALPG